MHILPIPLCYHMAAAVAVVVSVCVRDCCSSSDDGEMVKMVLTALLVRRQKEMIYMHERLSVVAELGKRERESGPKRTIPFETTEKRSYFIKPQQMEITNFE